jgi:hypothetical protein
LKKVTKFFRHESIGHGKIAMRKILFRYGNIRHRECKEIWSGSENIRHGECE